MIEYSENYFTNSDGLKLYYRDYNNAGDNVPVVLCIPGLTRNARDFNQIAAHMAKTCRVICLDLRGRGNSDWDDDPTRYRPDVYISDIMALLAHLKTPEIIAFGTSLGGLLIMMLAAMHPGTLKAAIINDIGPEVDPAGIKRIKSYVGKTTPPKTWAQAFAAVKIANLNTFPKFTDDQWEDFAQKTFTEKNGKLTASYDAAISQTFESNPEQTPDLWGVFDMMKSVPTVVLRGGISDILAEETLDEMAKRHPDLVAVTVPDIGHVPLMTEPECLAAIDNLVERCG